MTLMDIQRIFSDVPGVTVSRRRSFGPAHVSGPASRVWSRIRALGGVWDGRRQSWKVPVEEPDGIFWDVIK